MIQVACLCAAWCDACRQYRAVFDGVARQGDGPFVWVDVEEREDVLGDIDLETFPTILIARGARAVFFGPVLPQAAPLLRLVTALGREGLAQNHAEGHTAGPEAAQLLQRLRDAGLFAAPA